MRAADLLAEYETPLGNTVRLFRDWEAGDWYTMATLAEGTKSEIRISDPRVAADHFGYAFAHGGMVTGEFR
jgi:hypothetical protein